MKINLFIRKSVLFLCFLVLVSGLPAWAENYPWHLGGQGYEIAQKQQKITGQPYLIYFFATWCPYCKAFERNVLNSVKVRDGLAEVIKVRVDAEKERSISSKFKVTGFPRVYVVYPQSRKIRRINTDTNIKKFLDECKKAGLKLNS